MRFGVDEDHGRRGLSEEAGEGASGAGRGTRVRLSWFTWEGLACVVVLVTLCVLFGDDEPVEDAGSITLSGHSGLVETVRFSPDGQTLVTASWDRSVKLWDVGHFQERLGQEIASLPGEAEMYTATISPDGGTVAATGLRGLTIWNWRDPQSFPEVKPQFGPCRSVAFSPDGQRMAVGGFDRQIRIWDHKNDRVLAVLSGHRDGIQILVFVPDGSMLMSLGFDGALKFWDLRGYREIDRLEGNNENVHTVSLSPDGLTIALSRLGVREREIELWDLETNKLKLVCLGHQAEVHSLRFSPDGRTLASASGDQYLRFWNTETGKPAGRLEQPAGWVRSLDFSRDGRWLVYSGANNKIFLKRVDLPPEPSPPPQGS